MFMPGPDEKKDEKKQPGEERTVGQPPPLTRQRAIVGGVPQGVRPGLVGIISSHGERKNEDPEPDNNNDNTPNP